MSVNLSKPATFPTSDHTRALLTGTLGAEKFLHHDGLSRLTGAIHGEFQYRSSAEFGTPVLALFARISAEEFQSDQRDGFRYSTGIALRKTMTDRMRIFGAVSHNKRNGNNAVFDKRMILCASIWTTSSNHPAPCIWAVNTAKGYRDFGAVLECIRLSIYAGRRFLGLGVQLRLDATVLYKLGYNLALVAQLNRFLMESGTVDDQLCLVPSWSNCSVAIPQPHSLAYLIQF